MRDKSINVIVSDSNISKPFLTNLPCLCPEKAGITLFVAVLKLASSNGLFANMFSLNKKCYSRKCSRCSHNEPRLCATLQYYRRRFEAIIKLPYFPMYKSTFQDLKISPKIRPRLIHGSKLEIQAPVK